MTEITIYDLRRERGQYCEWCGEREMEQRHHCLVHDSKRFHSELTVRENLMGVCWQCHTGDCKVNGYEVRVKFFERQCRRYGLPHMLEWVASLPVKLMYSRRIDFIQDGVM